ncbi:MAG: FAD/NAD(P)-binding protein [Thermoleophilia bacterium]|nr:FAD/NAD(P)-binding protein [Thermoleophilia bacterium]
MVRIAIVGAGVSGRLVALNLLRRASAALEIRMFDRSDERSMGPAYSDDAPYLLLNVPAGRMSAVSEDPRHFLGWALAKGVAADESSFLPRRLYREYVLELLEETRRAQTGAASLKQVHAEVTGVDVEGRHARVTARGTEPYDADAVVLALGNFPPRRPRLTGGGAVGSGRFAEDPWAPPVMGSLAPHDTVVLVGTGQTTVDLVLKLHHRGHQGPVVALSRHGLLPLVHTTFEDYPSSVEELRQLASVSEMLRVVRRHLRRAEELGVDGRAVIDALRPDTQALWQRLSVAEKSRFLRHLFRYWEIVRSRIPPESMAVVDEMRASGRLDIVAGRLTDVVEDGEALEVRYRRQGSDTTETIRAGLVINCIGPESECERVDDPLVRDLLSKGLIRPGPVRLGIDASPDGAVIGRSGEASQVLYTLGSTMRGVLWEVVAVPEIRVQAERLARTLVDRGR